MSDNPILPDETEGQLDLDSAERQENLELKLLGIDATIKELGTNELAQRIRLRRTAFVTGIIVMIIMFCIMAYLLHKVISGPASFTDNTFKVAMLVAPIASITTITVALFVGAFRKFDDKDMDAIRKGISAGGTLIP